MLFPRFHQSTPRNRRTFLALFFLALAPYVARSQETIAPPLNASITPAPIANTPDAVLLLGADGVSYFRAALPDEKDEKTETEISAQSWLTQRAADSVSRIAPDGSGVLVRRDRRNDQAEIVQQLFWVTTKDGAPEETKLPLDTQSLANERGWNDFALRSISGLQWPLGQNRVLLRLTYVAKIANSPDAKPEEKLSAATNAATQELLGWYDLTAKTFTPIFQEPRLLGVEISPNGSFIHVIALHGDASHGDEKTNDALLLDSDGKEKPSKVLRALRTVGYLYRGWVDDSHLLLKKAGQNQLVIYDAQRDEISAPRGLGEAWSGSVSPDGQSALLFANEQSVDNAVPRAVDVRSGAALDWKLGGALPLRIAAWSNDNKFLLLLQGADARNIATRATLVSLSPFSSRQIVLPNNLGISAARFIYPKSTP